MLANSYHKLSEAREFFGGRLFSFGFCFSCGRLLMVVELQTISDKQPFYVPYPIKDAITSKGKLLSLEKLAIPASLRV